jgi:pimeloyl-ACP methyl ester carboxylesterase
MADEVLLPGMVAVEHTFDVPLDHADASGERITVFARELAHPDGRDRPFLVFFQGGPGFEAARPTRSPDGPAWLDRALEDFRVLMLDQRGTGRSSPANRRTLAGLTPQAQADYLAHFRADSIVLDAELIRRELTDEPWSVLGQSFGGMCAVTYLSFAPHGLREAFITGGLPGLTATADDVYRRTYRTVAARNAAHYERYPQDADTARRVADHLSGHEVRLPDGGLLTVEAFQSAGILLGQSGGSHALHYLLEDPFAGDGLSDAFLYAMMDQVSFATGPLYALLHEACYAQGQATRWSAQRIRAEYPEFGPEVSGTDPLYFTGEMIYPWMIDGDPVLRPFRQAAGILAERDGWPPLYDPSRLAANDVPVAAAVYYHDMYVDRELSMQTAAAIRGLRTWVTSEHEHNALRSAGGAVLGRLIGMVRGEI